MRSVVRQAAQTRAVQAAEVAAAAEGFRVNLQLRLPRRRRRRHVPCPTWRNRKRTCPMTFIRCMYVRCRIGAGGGREGAACVIVAVVWVFGG